MEVKRLSVGIRCPNRLGYSRLFRITGTSAKAVRKDELKKIVVLIFLENHESPLKRETMLSQLLSRGNTGNTLFFGKRECILLRSIDHRPLLQRKSFPVIHSVEKGLIQAAAYLATAPKSYALCAAYQQVQKDIREVENMPVPLHIRNAPTQLMKELGYGKEYKYPHDYPDHFVDEEYLPENLRGRTYYYPTELGFEKEIKKRLETWRKKRNEKA